MGQRGTAKGEDAIGVVVRDGGDGLGQAHSRPGAAGPHAIARGVVGIGQRAEDARAAPVREADELRRGVVRVLCGDAIGEDQRGPAAGGVVDRADRQGAPRDLREAAGRVVAVADGGLAGHRHGGPPPRGIVRVHDRAEGRGLGNQPVVQVPGPRDGAGQRVHDLDEAVAGIPDMADRRTVGIAHRHRPVEGVVGDPRHLPLAVGRARHVAVSVVGEALGALQRVDAADEAVHAVVHEARGLAPRVGDGHEIAVRVMLKSRRPARGVRDLREAIQPVIRIADSLPQGIGPGDQAPAPVAAERGHPPERVDRREDVHRVVAAELRPIAQPVGQPPQHSAKARDARPPAQRVRHLRRIADRVIGERRGLSQGIGDARDAPDARATGGHIAEAGGRGLGRSGQASHRRDIALGVAREGGPAAERIRHREHETGDRALVGRRLLDGGSQRPRIAQSIAPRVERHAPDDAARIGDVGPDDLAARVEAVGEPILGQIRQRLPDDAPRGVVLVRERNGSARVPDRQHPVLAVIRVVGDPALGVGHRGQAAGRVVAVGDDAAEGVPGLDDPVQRVVREVDPPVVGS